MRNGAVVGINRSGYQEKKTGSALVLNEKEFSFEGP